MRTVVRVMAGAAMSFALFGAACPNTTPETPPLPGSWLVLLCRAEDASLDPHPPSYYEELFKKTSTDLLFQYFDVVSNHTVDISGSRVRGWFPMSVTSADIAPAKRNNSTNPNRAQTAQDCRSAAIVGLTNAGISINPDNYVGVISVINQPVDVGQAAGKNVVLSDQLESNIGFAEHEMLHVYGLPHSNRMWDRDASADHLFMSGTDSVYYDCWDMMSYQKCVNTFPSSRGQQGPGVQSAYLEKLKWIQPNRVFAPGPVSVLRTITLAPVSDPTKPGFLLAKVEVPAGSYVVEYREQSGFDRQIPRATVLIKEQRFSNGRTFLVTRQNGTLDWQKGETFTDLKNFLSISVDDIVPGAATITINTGFGPTVGQLDDKCGDKYTGQTIPCAAMLRCGQRRSPPLVSVDYFCQP